MTRLQESPWVKPVHRPLELPRVENPPALSGRLNLYRIPFLRAFIDSRWPLFFIRTITLLGFVFTLLASMLGPRVGSHNFAIIVVWVAWWSVLKLGFIPLGGRTWCSVCPIPWVGDWLQQGGVLEQGKRGLGLNLRWPRALRGSWLQSAGFLLIGAFSAVTLTDPRVTGWVLAALFLLATGLSLLFEHRAFCTYICPIGGFSGMYSKVAPLELRVIDKTTCFEHRQKTCYQACPWGLYPLAMKDSSACGLCMQCLSACPKDNLALNLRPHGSDLVSAQPSSRLDESLLALIMLGSALVFSALFIGPWGGLKSAAYEIGSTAWAAYSAGFLFVCLVALPGLFALSVWLYQKLSHSGQSIKALVARFTPLLLPLGLFSWMAFTIAFALPKLNLVFEVFNDPLGWGWHWLSVDVASFSVYLSNLSPYLQLVLLFIGLGWSARLATRLSKVAGARNSLTSLPLLAFLLLYALSLTWLLLG